MEPASGCAEEAEGGDRLASYVLLVHPASRLAVEAAIARIEGVMLCDPGAYRSVGPRPRPAQLTARLGRILHLLAQGKTNKQIGRALGISHYTVRNHLVRLFRFYEVRNRAELAALIHRQTSPGAESRSRAA